GRSPTGPDNPSQTGLHGGISNLTQGYEAETAWWRSRPGRIAALPGGGRLHHANCAWRAAPASPARESAASVAKLPIRDELEPPRAALTPAKCHAERRHVPHRLPALPHPSLHPANMAAPVARAACPVRWSAENEAKRSGCAASNGH